MVLKNTIREEGQVGILVEGAGTSNEEQWGIVPPINRGVAPNATRYGTTRTGWYDGQDPLPDDVLPIYQFSPRFMRLPVEPATWGMDEIGEYRDLSVSAVPAVDRQSLSTTAQSKGSLAGPFDPIMPYYIMAAFLGDRIEGNPTEVAAGSGFYSHTVDSGRDPNSLSIATSDGVINSQTFYGMIPTKFMLRSNQGEGELKWTADFMGRGSAFEDVALAEQDYNFALPRRDLPPRPFVGTAMRMGSIVGSTANRLMEIELEMNRDVSLAWAAGLDYSRYANIRRIPSPTVTFTATVEFQRVPDLWVYSKGRRTGYGVTPTDVSGWTLDDIQSSFFDAPEAQGPWHFRWASQGLASVGAISLPWPIDDPTLDVNTLAAPAVDATATYRMGSVVTETAIKYRAITNFSKGDALDDAGQWRALPSLHDGRNAVDGFGRSGLDFSEGMLDLYLHKVSLGSDPIEVDRSQASATFQFKGTALFDTSQASGDSQGKLIRARMINKKKTNYATNDVKAETDDSPQNFEGTVTFGGIIVISVPSNFNLGAGDDRFVPSWTAVPGATSYMVRYRTTTGNNVAGVGNFSTVVGTSGTAVTGLLDSTWYEVQVQAIQGGNASVWSGSAWVETT